jgi:PAS domain S-box-containing protein
MNSGGNSGGPGAGVVAVAERLLQDERQRLRVMSPSESGRRRQRSFAIAGVVLAIGAALLLVVGGAWLSSGSSATACCTVAQAVSMAPASTAGSGGGFWLLDTTGFPRRWSCGEWPAMLGWLHIVSDLGIWGAYMAIPLMLGYFAVVKGSPLPAVTWLFVAFIATCGIGHLIEAVIFWEPIYRLSGVWKFITGLVSWATVVAMVPVLPRALRLPRVEELNEQLDEELSLRQATEIELRETTERLETANRELAFRQAALHTHAIVAITDVKGTITFVNDYFCQISGYSREELIGQNHRIINSGYHPKSFFTDMYRTISSGRAWHGTFRNRAKNGDLYWVKSTIVPFVGADGRVERYIAIRDDVTALKQTEAALSESVHELEQHAELLNRKKSEMEEFVYTVSHDLKSPLVTIMGYASHLRHAIETGEMDAAPDSIDRMVGACERLRRHIDDLLELSRVGRMVSEPAEVDLAAQIESLRIEFSGRLAFERIELVADLEVSSVMADPRRVYQVFENLLSNAITYGVTERNRTIRIGSRIRDGAVRIFVADRGPGIRPQHHERIFKLFERLHTDRAGTGVGLAIVRRIAEVHKGTAGVDSKPGEGATFWVDFPIGEGMHGR